jgi:type IV secretory pathway VirJ component
MFRTLLALAMVLAAASSADASERLEASVRGQALTLELYRPRGPGAPKGTVVIASGDVGWVGLAVTVAEQLSEDGYAVVGINVRQYLAAFTSGKTHLAAADVPGDYRTLVEAARQQMALPRPLVLSGVSEGAGLAVLAAADAKNHEWIDGVITMGLPATAELAWRWTDVGAWITKRDANEPSFSAFDFVPRIAPVPLYMIQSRRDEYVPAADYEKFAAIAKVPNKLVLIDASNHRFTDRRDELRRAIADGLAWIRGGGK